MCALLLVLSLFLRASLCVFSCEYLFVDPIDLSVAHACVCVFVMCSVLCALCRLFVYSYIGTYRSVRSLYVSHYCAVVYFLFPFLFNSLFVLPFPFRSQIHTLQLDRMEPGESLSCLYNAIAGLFIVRAQAKSLHICFRCWIVCGLLLMGGATAMCWKWAFTSLAGGFSDELNMLLWLCLHSLRYVYIVDYTNRLTFVYMCISRLQQNHNCLYKMLLFLATDRWNVYKEWSEIDGLGAACVYNITQEGNETKVKINI